MTGSLLDDNSLRAWREAQLIAHHTRCDWVGNERAIKPLAIVTAELTGGTGKLVCPCGRELESGPGCFELPGC